MTIADDQEWAAHVDGYLALLAAAQASLVNDFEGVWALRPEDPALVSDWIETVYAVARTNSAERLAALQADLVGSLPRL